MGNWAAYGAASDTTVKRKWLSLVELYNNNKKIKVAWLLNRTTIPICFWGRWTRIWCQICSITSGFFVLNEPFWQFLKNNIGYEYDVLENFSTAQIKDGTLYFKYWEKYFFCLHWTKTGFFFPPARSPLLITQATRRGEQACAQRQLSPLQIGDAKIVCNIITSKYNVQSQIWTALEVSIISDSYPMLF